MDKRLKPDGKDKVEPAHELLQKFWESQVSIGVATKAMRRISRMTQPEFAKHRHVSLATLRKIETGGSANAETLNKIADIFGLEVGFVKKPGKKIKTGVSAPGCPDFATPFISVKEALPDEFITNGSVNCVIAVWKKDRLDGCIPNPNICNVTYFLRHVEEFTHWMYSPEIPGND